MARTKAYEIVLEISDTLRKAVYERTVMYEKLVINGINRNKTGFATATVKDLAWANISLDWINDVKDNTKTFIVTQILPRMKLYNMLWHYPVTENSTDKGIIKDLVDNKIIYRTEVPGIYLVNPIKIWRGSPLICLEETKELLREHKKPSIELITDRRPSDKYTQHTGADMYKLLNGLSEEGEGEGEAEPNPLTP